MKKYKLVKTKKVIAISLATTMFASIVGGCTENKEKTNEKETTMSEETSVPDLSVHEKELVSYMNENIRSLFPELSDDISNNTSLILLLDIIAKEDENGKISSSVISNFKNIIDSDNMINEFNAFLGTLENSMIKNNKTISINELFPNDDDLKQDKQILSTIEGITSNIINSNNADEINSEFNKIYTLFVEEDEIDVNGFKFEIRDLSYGNRALAAAYARTSAYYARNYITDEQYKRIDDRTNDQNNKAQIKTILEILSNQMDEQSEIDVVDVFNNKYISVNNLLENRVNISPETQENLINYANLKYLASDKVSTKDKRQILGEYDDSYVSDVILATDALFTYNYNNQGNVVNMADLLIDDYAKTDDGLIDAMALNFVQYNTIMLLNETKDTDTFTQIFNNPYFQNIYSYILYRDVTYKYYDENGNISEFNIPWQGISDGVHFINNRTILDTLDKLPDFDYKNEYYNQAESNFEETIQYIQNTIREECEKVDVDEFVKTK